MRVIELRQHDFPHGSAELDRQVIAGGSLAGILYAVLYGRNIIRDADSVTGLIPAIHEGTGGLIAGALLFIALGVILGRAAQKKLA